MYKGKCLKDFSNQGGSAVAGKIGKVDDTNSKKYGLVVFYPEDKSIYQINLPVNWVERIDENAEIQYDIS